MLSPPCVLLFVGVFALRAHSDSNLLRRKREWIIPARPLKENNDYTSQEFIAKIRSDFDIDRDITYSLEGAGANAYPFNVFVVDPKTGLIRVTKVLDREVMDTYSMLGVAKFNDGTDAEKKMDIRIKVVDENDNAPVFDTMKPVDVYELSPTGTLVTRVTATDADEPGNPNSRLVYSIIKQNPNEDMFLMNNDGNIFVNKPSLDRERIDQYIVTVKAQDLNGRREGLTGTSTLTINVLDVNDNLPTLEKEKYEGSIEENTQGVEVMRIKAQDLDLKDTENWEPVFDIVKGNEAKYFSIKKDPKTNEGILMLDKPVDYENVKNLDLGLMVRNKAPPHGKVTENTPYKTYPVKINVRNQREGPDFDPKVKVITMSEGGSTTITDVIARYPAIDQDTGKPAENVKYVKGSDPDNWLTIDPDTAEIKMNKMPDRESTFLVNGTYYAKVLCISEDMPSSTATGTVAIQVEDFNDHCPTLTSTIETMCIPNDAVFVTAIDEDDFPNGAPFTFEIIPENTKGKWQVEHLNDTTAILRAQDSKWPGLHIVEVLVKDGQGVACPKPQKVTVQVCTCEDEVRCGKRGTHGQPSKRAELGPAGIGLLLLGLLLLLLIPLLLLFCQCGGAAGLPVDTRDIPFETKSHLINYCTEGQGENTEVPLTYLPTQVVLGDVTDRMNQSAFVEENIEQSWLMNQANMNTSYSRLGNRAVRGAAAGTYDSIALPDHILAQYYMQKSHSGGENLAVKDTFLKYNFEGQGSSTGSVGCCSLLETDNDLHFLDDLGPKFKTLAEVCGGLKIQNVATSMPSTSSTMVVSEPLPEPPKLSPAQHTVIQKEDRSQVLKEMTMTTAAQAVENQGQMLLVQQQQPIYYTTATTPMLQPIQYVVQPQVQNTMLLAEAPATNLQGMVLAAPSQGMLLQGQRALSGGQTKNPGIVLMDNSKIQTSGATRSGLQAMVVVDSNVSAGSVKVRKGSQTSLLQGDALQTGGISGAQRVLVVEGSSKGSGQTFQEAKGASQKSNPSGSVKSFSSKSSTKFTGSRMASSSSPVVSRIPSYHKVVVQETRK
uniref:desmoglein-2.1-like isoform X2 n=1 Tax=Doryrhamphus excisus TaxID=161450 RepID=UPI0025ADD842|nr:desmoglein-2.1-like isoform X2 [Doryrhamphus excisus]